MPVCKKCGCFTSDPNVCLNCGAPREKSAPVKKRPEEPRVKWAEEPAAKRTEEPRAKRTEEPRAKRAETPRAGLTEEPRVKKAVRPAALDEAAINDKEMFEPVGETSMSLMPTSSPRALTSAPPELPWLMAASVWMNDSTPLAPMERALAETIPAVTVLLSPSGLPTASTHSPTFRSSLLAIAIVGRFLPSTLMRARSVVLSVPTMRAENSRLSLSVTVSSSAPSTMWLLVTIYPSGEMMTPEPVAVFLGV